MQFRFEAELPVFDHFLLAGILFDTDLTDIRQSRAKLQALFKPGNGHAQLIVQ
ncbi:MAG: hypothetical protein JSS02_12945 [Planctomycetes bacterium]|nr:hypothetical protein [Planctomycetota bacterium]